MPLTPSSFFLGVKLNTPNGKNDGSVGNVRYFECEPLYGLFTRRGCLKRVTEIPVGFFPKYANLGLRF